MQAIVAAAHTDAPAPWILVKAEMCGYFGRLPSELEKEPWDEIMKVWQAHCLYQSARAERLAARTK